MTARKQEKWIFQNKGNLNVKFIGAVGAVHCYDNFLYGLIRVKNFV